MAVVDVVWAFHDPPPSTLFQIAPSAPLTYATDGLGNARLLRSGAPDRTWELQAPPLFVLRHTTPPSLTRSAVRPCAAIPRSGAVPPLVRKKSAPPFVLR